MKTLFLSFLISTSIFAACDLNGNCYNTIGNTTYGNNLRTGSSWSQTNNGSSYSGRDSNGNYYNGNSATGYYHNSGSGKTCYGTGAFRTCY